MTRVSRLRALAAMTCLAAAGMALEPGTAEPSRKQLLASLSEEDRAWLTELVAPIILPEEDKIFLGLTEAYQREAFKEDFWRRRETPGLLPPLGPGYRFRYQELRQLADEKYDGWTHDAGRMVLRWGEPDSIFTPHCGGEDVFYDIELWTYSHSDSTPFRGTERYIFFRPSIGNSPRRLWSLSDSDKDVFAPNACGRNHFADLLNKDCRHPTDDRCGQCDDRCEVYKAYAEIRTRQGSAMGALTEQARLFKPLEVSTEGLERQKSKWATTTDPNAKTLRVIGPSSAPIATPSPTPTPEPKHALSAEEIRDRIQKLEPKYRDFVDLARPLLTDAELSDFLQMRAAEKDRFIREFWSRHS